MRNHKISRSLATVVVSLATTLAPAWAQLSSSPVPAQNPGSEKTLTGIVSDSYCKGRQLQKAQTHFHARSSAFTKKAATTSSSWAMTSMF